MKTTDPCEHDALIVTIAKRFAWATYHGGIEWEDLMQAGRMGVMDARRTYDPNHASGASFSSWASEKIRQHVRILARDQGRSVRVPHQAAYQAFKRGTPIVIRRYSTDQSAIEHPDWPPMLDRLGFTSPAPNTDRLEAEQRSELVAAALAGLDERAADMVRRRYWLGHNFREIGAAHSVTRERARQIIAESVQKMAKNTNLREAA